MFETAVRTKMRFPYRGMISVEDLWDLSLRSLDTVFKSLNSQLQKEKEESLLGDKTPQDKEVELQIKIVKHIFNVKVEELEARENAKKRKEQKQKIMELIAEKQDESLKGKSIDELSKMLEELD